MDTQAETTDETSGIEASAPRRWPWLVGGLVLVAAVVAVLIATTGGSEETPQPEAAPTTAEVVRTDLVDETTYTGTLGRPDAEPVAAGRTGTVTATPAPGDEISPGDALFRVDEQPVVLLEGSIPAFRDLGYGDTDLSLPAGRQGTITALPPEGAILSEGDVIVRIDDTPSVVLAGDLPMYRVLADGVDEGADVEQLEAALVRLGYDPDGDVTVDQDFTAATEAMVERWQEDLGLEETGSVAPGDIVFGPLPAQVVTVVSDVGSVVSATSPLLEITGGDPIAGPDVTQLEASLVALGHLAGADDVLGTDTVAAIAAFQDAVGMDVDGVLALGEVVFRAGTVRIAEVVADVGAAVTPSTPVVAAGSLDLVVRLDLPAEDQGTLVAGDAVTIELPDRSETTGVVSSVASVATTDPQGSVTFDVEIALDDPSVAGDLDEAPVDVRVVSDTAEDVLAVPVTALLALAEGGYGVEVVDADGSVRLVGVEPGFFADGLVEITGDVTAGDSVVVP